MVKNFLPNLYKIYCRRKIHRNDGKKNNSQEIKKNLIGKDAVANK